MLLLATTLPLAAQSRLYVLEPDKAYHPVLKVSDGHPFIMEKGALVAAHGDRYALRKVDEFLPVYIEVRGLKVATTDHQQIAVNADIAQPQGISGGGVFDGAGDAHPNPLGHRANQGDPQGQIESVFHFDAKFEADYPLDDVFLVIEAEFANAGKSLVVCEVGQLQERKPKPFTYAVARKQSFGSVRATMHLFVGGTEVLQSEQPEAFRREQLDRMIAQRIIGVKDAGPKPFFGSTPGYPAALRPSGLKGEVVVTVRVTPQGAVLDPVVDRTNNPAFAEAALEAVREWRFLPRVQNGRPVETKVSIPIDFDPPAAKE
jgi:TonB family protein